MPSSRRSFLYSVGAVAGAGAVGAAYTGYPESGAAEASPRPTALVAGSLLHLAERVPGATVEAHGSAAVRRLVVSGARDPDAVALADPRLFAGIADRATLFATNALVIAYDPASEYAPVLRHDWRTAIERDGIRLARTDPELDPLGYRTVMALRLAAREYGVDAEGVLADSYVRPETAMLNTVAAGETDAAFAYRNMAVQRDVPYVTLPDRIDFSSPAHAETYASVSFRLNGREIRGAPIRYAATATTEAGTEWVDRLVSDATRLERAGFAVPERYPRRSVPVGGR